MPDGQRNAVVVVVNGESMLEFDRERPLSEAQRRSLESMDRRMDAGIDLAGQAIAAPDTLQRAQFVALQLVTAVGAGDEALAAAACSYLAQRLPDLKQVRALHGAGEVKVELVFDRDYAPETPVTFVRTPVRGD